MNKSLISLLLTACCTLFSTSAAWADFDPAYEVNLAKGVVQLNNSDYAGAAAIFGGMRSTYPDDPKIMLLQGIALSRNGQYEEAEKPLRQAASLQYEPARTNYELGVTAFHRGDLAAAKEFFTKAENLSKDPAITSSADAFVAEVDRLSRKKRYEIAVTTGLQYDSNVPLLAGEQIVIGQGHETRTDLRAILALRGDITLLKSPVKVTAGYSFYQSIHTRLADYNVQNHEAQIKAEYPVAGNAVLEAAYRFDYTLLGGDRYSRIHTFTPAVKVAFFRDMPTRFVYEYADKKFYDLDISETNHQRSGSTNTFGIEQTFNVTRNLSLLVAYHFDTHNADGDFYSYDGNRFEIGMNYSHDNKWLFSARAEYYDRNYDGRSEFFNQTRDDITRTFSLGFTKPLSQTFSVNVNQTFVVNTSSISFYSYDRAVTGVFLTARF